jgi:fructose/tagatose bisphosphate aldolase
MIVTTAQLYKVAYGKFAIGAYNINNMEQCLGLFRGNVQSKALGRLGGVEEDIKVNIDTDGRLVWTRVHREFFRDHPEQFDFRPPGKTFVEEYANFIAHKNEKLDSAGQLDTVRASIKA